ncbi:di-heme oxidoredictase family protein [Methylosinus sp. R-45379]|uniref:di-heme oxidoreductase family protein n=1 Tax=Methylosinus sp. R-45379 TaxID=980563 RepID=UPI0007C8D054|nr:di-heme oxidoredictase family protein [Methylosinus sp. R-45379]
MRRGIFRPAARVASAVLIGSFLVGSLVSASAEEFPREAYSYPVAGLDAAAEDAFYRGRVEFMRSWSFPPGGGEASGLGPLFNRISCAACHQKNGRGQPPSGPDERMLSMLVRLSVPGDGPHGAPKPHPAYGGQLNEEGAPGVPGEGRAAISWEAITATLADGSIVALRRPRIEFVGLAYGPLDGALFSPRVAPAVFGDGLLESVPIETMKRIAAEQPAQGVHGVVNEVYDVISGQMVPGRFGWKANSPNLKQQIAEAFIGDLGVTTPLFPEDQCTEQQAACRAATKSKNRPELDAIRLDDIDFFNAHLAPPPRRDTDNPQVARGETLFLASGCGVCHVPSLKTEAHPKFSQTLPAQTIAPYTDLLLHDMGEALADGRPDFHASGRQWRTAPLWGVGLAPIVNEHSLLLHDGRARTLEEAILWHGGEGEAAKAAYAALKRDEREALIAFLRSL